jgi:hypothetical protein
MLLASVSVLLILAAIPFQFYFENIFLVRLSVGLAMIFLLVSLIRWLFFKNPDRQLLRFAVAEDRLRIEYINKNKSLNKVHEILLSQLRGYSMFAYSNMPRQIGIIFKLKDHTKLKVTLEYSKVINGTETQTEEIIEEIISSFRKYNANHIEKIRKTPGFIVSWEEMALIVIFIVSLITSLYFHAKMKRLPATTVSPIFTYFVFIIARYKELQEIKKSNMDLESPVLEQE